MSTEELYREYEAVSEAVDTIINFLNEKGTWINSIRWKSNADGTILGTDWGYFEEGMGEIKDYCLSKERSSE